MASLQLGRASLMAKFYVENAYRIVPVNPEDHQLLGLKWQGAFYVNMVRPFGVRSAPYMFTWLADLVKWIVTKEYEVTFLMHYLKDFHILAVST